MLVMAFHARTRCALVERLPDARGREVVFLAHCLLDENTRYLGGACRACCVREVVDACLDAGLGVVQMPCPEQEVWGGVLKRRMLWLYGLERRNRLAAALVRLGRPIATWYVRRRSRRLARRIAAQIDDDVRSGVRVRAIIGIDGSPSCGVHTTIDAGRFVDAMMRVDVARFSTAAQNAMVRRFAAPGRGLFVDELARALRRRHLDVPLVAHDLFRELDGLPSALVLATTDPGSASPASTGAGPAA